MTDNIAAAPSPSAGLAGAGADPVGGIEVRGLFPTPVLLVAVAQAAALNACLRPLLLAQAGVRPSVAKSNQGGWQSGDDLLEWAGDAGRQMVRIAADLADAITVTHRGNGLLRQSIGWRANAWGNVSRRGDANFFHHHGGAYWSAVYYVDDGGIADHPDWGGALELQDPRGVAPGMYAPHLRCGLPGFVSAGLSEQIRPRTGQLILFPAWLGHAVERYDGPGTRISIALNLCPPDLCPPNLCP